MKPFQHVILMSYVQTEWAANRLFSFVQGQVADATFLSDCPRTGFHFADGLGHFLGFLLQTILLETFMQLLKTAQGLWIT
jgi:hypothetical protein